MFGAKAFSPFACFFQCLGNYLRVVGIWVLIAGGWATNILGINFDDGMSLIFLLFKIWRHSRWLPWAGPPPLRLSILLFDFLLVVGEHYIDGIPVILSSFSDFINGPMLSTRGLPRSRSLWARPYWINTIWVMHWQGKCLDDRSDRRLWRDSLRVLSWETLPCWSNKRGLLAWMEIYITCRTIEVRRFLPDLVSNDDV